MQILLYLIWGLFALWLGKKAYVWYCDKAVEIDVETHKENILKADEVESNVKDFALLNGSKVKTENKDKFLKGEELNG